MLSKDIRATFLDFFQEKDHLVLPGFSLIPQNDHSFADRCGMAPLKPYFTGAKKPPHHRLPPVKVCPHRISTMWVGPPGMPLFEMLGNFSFGDYFKEA